MTTKELLLDTELRFKTSRSGGAGGQNVNKVATKVLLEFDIINSSVLTSEQKVMLLKALSSKITKDGILQLVCQTERSQLGNKEIVKHKFYEMLKKSFIKKKKRKPSKPSLAAKQKRLTNKKHTSEIKQIRNKKIILE